MHLLRLIFSGILFIISAVILTGQEYRASARRYGISDGLPHRWVSAVLEDRRGFIWAAGGGGVARFDGYRFMTFTKADNGLSNVVINNLVEDADGFIWAVSASPRKSIASIDIIDPLAGTVTRSSVFFTNHPMPVKAGQLMSDGQQGPGGVLYFPRSDTAGWAMYHPSSGWRLVKLNQLTQPFTIYNITDEGHVWGMIKPIPGKEDEILLEVDPEGREIRRYTSTAAENKFRHYDEYTGEPGSFFVVENAPDWRNRLFWKINADGTREQIFPPLSPDGESTGVLARLNNGKVWFNEMRLYENGRVLLDLKKIYPELAEHKLVCWQYDHQGLIWVGTAFGLFLVDIREDYFTRYLHDPNAPIGTGIPCRGLLRIGNQLIVNTDRVAAGQISINLDNGATQMIRYPGYIWGLSEGAQGEIWSDAGKDFHPGIACYNLQSGATLRSFDLPGKTWFIFKENDQRLLVANEKGVFLLDTDSGPIRPLPHDHFPELDNSTVSFIGRSHNGQIWLCSAKGFYRIDAGRGVTERIFSETEFGEIVHFHEDADGVFWLATLGAGLLRWDPKTGQKQLFFRNSGLMNANLYAVYEDRNGCLWIPSDYGIVQFDKKTLHVRHTWITADGTAQDEFNRISHLADTQGNLYFGGLNGLTVFNPDDFYVREHNDMPPLQIAISNLTILNNSGVMRNVTASTVKTGMLETGPGDSYLQIEFALLDYLNAQSVNYSWKIEGVDADWNFTTKPSLLLNNLPHGRHRLHIRAEAPGGGAVSGELIIELLVLPPFYLRLWFILLMLSLAGAGVWYWQRRHLWEKAKLERLVASATAKIGEDKKTIEQQAVALRRLDEAKSRFFANISHELRTPLTLMLGPLSSVLKLRSIDEATAKMVNMAQRHGKHLLDLINQILDLSKLESGRLELHESNVLLYREIFQLAAVFENQAKLSQTGFNFTFHADKKLAVVTDFQKVRTVISNLLSNALKFTPEGGRIDFDVLVSPENLLQIKVCDTGRGIHPDDLPHIFDRFYQTSQPGTPLEGGTGIGLALSHEFVMLLSGKIEVESRVGYGSVFTVLIPVKPIASANHAEEITEEIQTELPGEIAASMVVTQDSLPTVLLAEDNPDLRTYLEILLSENYRVIAVANGRAALDWLRQEGHSCTLIITDLMMPEMDGYQLIGELKTDPRFQQIPVVVLTARADTDDKLRALRIGVDDYLIKPFEAEELLARTINLTANYQKRKTAVTVAGEAEPEDASPQDSSLAPGDLEWLERLENVVLASISDFDLNAENLASKMYISRSQLFRRVKALTGLNVNDYVQEIRFRQARLLLEQKKYPTVKAVALSVGFRHVNNFALNFKKRFGKSPASYFS